MPEICRFFSIVIRMYASEHAPPHFHAFYNEFEALFSIANGEKIEGKFPKKQENLVKAWAKIYKETLMENWHSLTTGKGTFKKIEPKN